MQKFWVLTIALGCLVAVKAAHAQSPETFLSELQRASRQDDRAALAALVHYPAVVVMGGLRIPFPNSAALLKSGDAIFTPALRTVIARATLGEKGLIVDSGALTVRSIAGRLRITSIVVPPPDSGHGASAGRSEPRRITLRAGPRPAQAAGSLAPGGADIFVVSVARGQRLEVRLERVPVGAAAIRVVEAARGTPLNAASADNARVVAGRAADNAEYRIEVRRLGDADPAAVTYLLSVGVR